MTVTGDFPSVK